MTTTRNDPLNKSKFNMSATFIPKASPATVATGFLEADSSISKAFNSRNKKAYQNSFNKQHGEGVKGMNARATAWCPHSSQTNIKGTSNTSQQMKGKPTK